MKEENTTIQNENAAIPAQTERGLRPRRNRWGSMGLTMLCLSLSLLFCTGGAVAWLSRNRYTQSSDMNVKAATTPNLVIALPSNGLTQPIQNANILQQSLSPFVVSMSAGAVGLTAATHDAGFASELKCVSNTADLDRISGLALSGKTLTFENAQVGTNYLDFTVHLAAAGGNLSGVDLVATIDSPVAGISDDTIKALSVDFRVATTKNGTPQYIGTLNVAGKNRDNTGAALTELSIISNGTVLANTTDYITVTMRVYFDGALLKEAGKTYLNAANLNTNNLSLGITFSARNHPTS